MKKSISQKSILPIILQAMRLPSLLYIIPAVLTGTAAWYGQGGRIDQFFFWNSMFFSFFIQQYIVYINDGMDWKTDTENKTFTLFSGGSRVLPTYLLKPGVVLTAGFVCAVIVLGISTLLCFQGRPLALGYGLISLILLASYSLPPVKLNYRGGGEFLQVIGTAFVLPLFGWYVYAGNLEQFPFMLLLVLLPAHFAQAAAVGLPDAWSDKKGGKKTLTILFGDSPVKILCIVLAALSSLLGIYWVLTSSYLAEHKALYFLPGLACALFGTLAIKAKPATKMMDNFLIFIITAGILITLATSLIFLI